MAYRGTRKTIPSSRYGGLLEIMETTGWDWWTLQEQPADLVDEMLVKHTAKNRIEAEQATKAGKAQHGKRR